VIIKKSEVKNFVGGDFRISAEFYDALDKVVERTIKDAIKRAKENGRKTLKAYDL